MHVGVEYSYAGVGFACAFEQDQYGREDGNPVFMTMACPEEPRFRVYHRIDVYVSIFACMVTDLAAVLDQNYSEA